MKRTLVVFAVLLMVIYSYSVSHAATEKRIYVDYDNDCGVNSCDYTSIVAAEYAEEDDLTSGSGTYLVFEVYEYEETGRLIIDGYTTSASCFIEIRGADYDRIETGANKNVGVWSTERFRFNVSSGSYYRTVFPRENYVKLINLQIKNSINMGTIGIGNNMEAITGQEYVGNIIILDNDIGSAGGCFYFSYGLGSSDNAIVNNVCGILGDNSLNFLTCKYNAGCGSGSGETAVYNNTVVFAEPTIGNHYCFNLVADKTRVINNICQDDKNVIDQCGNAPTGESLYSDNDYNICTTTDVTGGTNDKGDIDDVLFVNKSGWDLHLSSSDTRAYDEGTDLSSDDLYPFDEDIDGDTRTRWSIGADD